MTENELQTSGETGEAASGDGQPSRSLAERLMALDPTVPEGSVRESRPSAAMGRPAEAPAERGASAAERRSNWAAGLAARDLGREAWRLNPAILEGALDEARTYIRVAYIAFLASVAVVFLAAVVSTIVFFGSLASGAEWKQLAISGGFSLVVVVLLVFLQYRPARGFGSAASQVMQLEATRTHLNKSFEFWEKFLNERGESKPLAAQDVAMAVSSLTAASQGLIELDGRPAKVSETARKKDAKQQEAPAPTKNMPPPGRY